MCVIFVIIVCIVAFAVQTDWPAGHYGPLHAEDKHLTLSDNRKLYYTDYGKSEDVPVLYLYGWPNFRHLPSLTVELLVSSGLRVVVPERPGWGRSTKFAHTPQSYSKDVLELLAFLNLTKLHLIGFSGGSLYAYRLAVDAPKLFKSLTVVGGLVPLPQFEQSSYKAESELEKIKYLADYPFLLRFLIWVFRLMIIYGSESAVLGDLKDSVSQLDYDLHINHKQILEWQISSTLEAWSQGSFAAFQEAMGFLSDWEFSLSSVNHVAKTVPTLLLHGEEDLNAAVSYAKFMCEKLDRAKCKILPNAGHFFHLVNVQEIVAHINGQE